MSRIIRTLAATLVAGGAAATASAGFDDPRLYVIGPGGQDVEELDIVPSADWLLVGVRVDVANGHVYWTHGSFNAGRIRRANLDGSNVVTLLAGSSLPPTTSSASPRGFAAGSPAGRPLHAQCG